MTTQSTVQNAVSKAMPAANQKEDTLPKVEENQLNKDAVKVAYKAIDQAYTIQVGQGGIEDTENKLEGLRGKVGECVYAVAMRSLDEVGEHLKMARGYFLALCGMAEKHLVNKHIKDKGEELPVGKLIPLWANYKSAIAKGLELGISPHETIEGTDTPKYATAAQYRKAVQDYEAQQRATGSQAGNDRQSAGQVATQLQVITRGWSEQMSAATQVLNQEINRLSKEDQDKFVPKILGLANEVHEYAEAKLKESMAPSDSEMRTESLDLEGLDPGTKAAMQAALDSHVKAGKPQEGKVVAEELARAGRAKGASSKTEQAKRGGSRAA